MNSTPNFADWLAIYNGIHLYCRGLDRCDANTLASVFWPDAKINLGSDASLTGAQYTAFVIPELKRLFTHTMHRISNVLIDIDGAQAKSECSLYAYHTMKRENGPLVDLVVGGRYLDQWEKRNQEWRMTRRQLVWDWHRTLGDKQDWKECLLGVPLVTGDYHPQDPLYR